LDGRTVEKGHLVYSSKVWSKEFKYEPWGSYQVVALFGKQYFAGYPESSFTDEVNSLERGELRTILIDEDTPSTLKFNSTIALQEGYILAVRDVSVKTGVVNFLLLKNDQLVYSSIVDIGDTFVYKINDIPVILVHLANAMRGDDDGLAEIDAVFQVSDEPYFKIFDGGRIGNMMLSHYSEEDMEFENNRTLTFSRDSMVPLTPDLQIMVLDLPDLVYYPMGGIFDYGIYEIRGPTFDGNSSIPSTMGKYNTTVAARWDSSNYSGFFFDPENLLGSEHLIIHRFNGRSVMPTTMPKAYENNNTVVQDGLQYTALVQAKDFEYKPWGHYFVVNFPGVPTPWFAGYDSSMEVERPSKSLIEREYLGMVLMDIELKTTPENQILAGNYSLNEGYEMRIRDVDNDSIFIQLLKNGITVDSSVVKSNSTYIYKKDLEDVKDMPIIMIHFSGVFDGGKERFALIDGIFQISDQYVLPIEPGRGMGELEVVAVLPDQIIMINTDRINFNRDSKVNIGPGMDVRVADNDTFRYYLYTSAYVVPAPEPPMLNIQRNVTSSGSANFSMIVQAAEIRQVLMSILDSNNRTVYSRDITSLGMGSDQFWRFDWIWNATTRQIGDNGSVLLDAGSLPLNGLLYLNGSSLPVMVYVTIDPQGRISEITDGASVYYITKSEYSKLNLTLDYDSMMANSTARKDFFQIKPGVSILQFYDLLNTGLAPSGINYTLEGNLNDLLPHINVAGARPGRYELRVRVENVVNAIMPTTGEYFNVTPIEMRNVSLDSVQAFPGGQATVRLAVPGPGGNKAVNITYDASKLTPLSISGDGKATWQINATSGEIGVLLPEGSDAANLTFAVKKGISTNDTIDLNITGMSGFVADVVSNGAINIVKGKTSPSLGLLASLAALAAGAWARRRKDQV
ncbi:MAG: S-layer protein domain-containing protein, partial [Methanothrix sp.]|nr:S-layer protein domain-containing protein [Methanothrix sp.]